MFQISVVKFDVEQTQVGGTGLLQTANLICKECEGLNPEQECANTGRVIDCQMMQNMWDFWLFGGYVFGFCFFVLFLKARMMLLGW